MIFGLGDLDNSVDVTINWPSGRDMEFSVASANFGEIMSVSEPDSFTIDDTSVTFGSRSAGYQQPGLGIHLGDRPLDRARI